MFLASMLGRCAQRLPPSALTLNLLLFDPVPGNLVMTTRRDCLRILTSTRSMDLLVLFIPPHDDHARDGCAGIG